MHETGNVAAQARDLAHQRRGQEAVLLGRRQEQRFAVRDQVPVHAGELELVLEVRRPRAGRAEHAGADFLHEMREQRVEASTRTFGNVAIDTRARPHALFQRQRRALARAFATPTMIVSNSDAARCTRSTWPLVIGRRCPDRRRSGCATRSCGWSSWTRDGTGQCTSAGRGFRPEKQVPGLARGAFAVQRPAFGGGECAPFASST
jgi:hypothetical protein